MNSLLYGAITIFSLALILLVLFRLVSGVDKQHSTQLLIFALAANTVGCLSELLYTLAEGRTQPFAYALNVFSDIAYFSMTGIAAFLWLLYCLVSNGKLISAKQPKFWLCAAPAIVLTLFSLLSVKLPLLFYVDAQNNYHRGPFHFLHLLIGFGYLIAAALFCLHTAAECGNEAERPRLYIMALYVLFPIVGGSLQALIFGFPILCMGIAFGTIMVYLQVLDQQISVDSLTHLNNRSEMFRYLYSRISRYTPERKLYLVIFDVDKFKSINDIYGHVEGDLALQLVAEALRRVFSQRNMFVSRYGGDEFIVICEDFPYDKLDGLCHGIKVVLDQVTAKASVAYSLSMCYGIAEYTPAIKTQQALLRLADAELYKAKAARTQKAVHESKRDKGSLL